MAKRAKKRAVRKVAKRARQVILPQKLSSLIKICLRDMRKAEALPEEYVINMTEWYSPNQQVSCHLNDGTVVKQHTICVVCAAGSVMAFSLVNDRQKNRVLGPDDFGENEPQLDAINHLRCGECIAAYRAIHGYGNSEDEDDKTNQKLVNLSSDIPEYDPIDPEPFHKAMTKLQERLARAGF